MTTIINGSSPSITFSDGTTQTTAANVFLATGTALLFYQAAAPTGWTKSVTNNNKALRVVSGTGGVSGGTVAFTTAFASQSVTGTIGATTLSTAQLASHTHGASNTNNTSINHAHGWSNSQPVAANVAYGVGTPGFTQVTFGDTSFVNSTSNSDPTHAHGGAGNTGSQGSGSSHDHTFAGTAINLAVQYIDVIVCTKD